MSELNFIRRFENDPESQKVMLLLLRSYAVAVQKKINLPTLTYVDQIAGSLDITRSRAKAIADEYIKKFFKVPKFNLNQTMSLYLGMFNATIDSGDLVNLNDIKRTVQQKGFVEKTVDGINIKPVKFQMGYGRFKRIFEYTSEYGNKNINKKHDPTYVQFLLKIQKGDKIQGASFNIYHTGRIRFSGGYLDGNEREVKALVKFISENYFPINLRLPITINNNTMEVKLGTDVRILGIYTTLDATTGGARFDGYTLSATFEPERNRFITKQRKNSPFLYVTFKKGKDDKFGLVISRTGTVIIEGAKNIEQTIAVTRRFFTALKDSGLLEDPPARKKNVSIKHKQSKLARRFNMKPAPEVTRRGTTCPKNRRPNPYSFQGACSSLSFYVRPNPQGQPCCYKKPKSIQYMRNRLENRYNRANVKVPNAVRKTFGIGGNTNNKENNIGRTSLNNLPITFNKSIGKNKKNPVGLKIGSRQCSRYSKVALVDIAKRKGITLPKKTTKPILCDLLSKLVTSPSPKRKTPTPNRPGPSSPKRKTPTPNRPGPSRPRRKTPTPSPTVSMNSSANNNFNNLLSFAERL